MKKLNIVGVGMGNIDYLINQASKIILESKIIVTTERIKNSMDIIDKDIYALSISDINDFIKDNDEDITVLVSGDCGFYSLSKLIVKNFEGSRKINIVNGLNSMQYFASKLNMCYEDWVSLSLHGRNTYSVVGTVCYNKHTFVLTGGKNKTENICKLLCDFGLGDKKAFVGEFLSYENERILDGTVKQLSNIKFEDLAVLLIINENPADNYIPICDNKFERNKTPMTKEAVRWVSINKLSINPEDIIFDVGSGTGSVSIEMARKCFKGIVVSIEKDKDAFDILNVNIKKFGAFNIMPINDTAPCMRNLPVPNKVFIGGSNNNIDNIIEWLLCLSEKVKLKVVINCVTLETLNKSLYTLKKLKLENIDLCCVNVSNSKKIGEYNMMVANNPVYIISGEYNAL